MKQIKPYSSTCFRKKKVQGKNLNYGNKMCGGNSSQVSIVWYLAWVLGDGHCFRWVLLDKADQSLFLLDLLLGAPVVCKAVEM